MEPVSTERHPESVRRTGMISFFSRTRRYLLLPPPPLRERMLDAPRLLLERAPEPLYVLRSPLPMALRLLPGRDMSRLPMRSGLLVAEARLPVPAFEVEGRFPAVEPPRLAAFVDGRLPLRWPL